LQQEEPVEIMELLEMLPLEVPEARGAEVQPRWQVLEDLEVILEQPEPLEDQIPIIH
jgi:hypothetical protein